MRLPIFAALCLSGILCGYSVQAAEDAWKNAAFLCSAPDGFLFPSKPETNGNPSPCDDGDMTLFNGILCYAGETIGCDAVQRAQGDNGRFWRSPLRAQNGNLHYEQGDEYRGDAGGDKSFSPDMQTGVLLWALRTRAEDSTRQSLIRWYTWMSDNRPCAATKLFSSDCLYRNLPRYCEDANCTMRPLDRDVDNAVYSFVTGGLTPPDGIVNYNNKIAEMLSPSFLISVDVGLPAALITQAYLNTALGDKLLLAAQVESGFALHLTAIRAWMLIEMQHVDVLEARAAIAKVVEREPNNPFFLFIHEGPTERVVDLTKNYCPHPATSAESLKYEWLWEQSDSATWPKPFSRNQPDGTSRTTAMLWDCIAMRALLKRQNLGKDSAVDAVNAVNSILLLDDQD